MNISPVKIHHPDCCHGWGIEFNFEELNWDAGADAFVSAVRNTLRDAGYDIRSKWFHQCGSSSVQNGKYYGYQFFECFDSEAQKRAEWLADTVAGVLATTVIH